MGVRKTESKIPAAYQAADLGEAVESSDGKISLISFFTSPLSPGPQNTYLVMVTDVSLANTVKSFHWYIDEDGSPPLSFMKQIGLAQ